MVRHGMLLVVALVATSCASASAPPVVPPVCAKPPPPAAPSTQAVDPAGEWELRWDRTFANWTPPIFHGKLSIKRDGSHWTGRLVFRESSAQPVFESLRVDGDRIEIVFVADATEGAGREELTLSGLIRAGRVIGEMRWGKTIPWTPVGGRRVVLPALNHAPVDHSLPPVNVAANADQARLNALIDHAKEERSSALVILKDGKVGVELYREGYDGGPLSAMSASKSIVSLAIGMLIADGKLSLDTNMGSLFPEWKKLGAKSTITIRQLLTHTSGLDPSRANWTNETIREHALKAKLVFPPGTRFQYDNGAVDLLAVVFKQASGVSLDAYLETRIFQKLDVIGASWMKDSEGTPRAAGELIIRPIDLAKLGQLMLDGGMWQGQRLVPAEWIARSTDAGQGFEEDCGLLWWREGAFAQGLTEPVLDSWRDLGMDEALLRSARPLLRKTYATRIEYATALKAALGSTVFQKLDLALQRGDHVPFSATVAAGPVRGFSARGWLGQYLVVLPKAHVVAVRMRSGEDTDREGDGKLEVDGYGSFPDDVARVF